MSDRLSTMPADMIWEILRRVDALEVGGMTGMNRYLREAIANPDFTNQYNRLRLSFSSWSFVHTLDEDSPISGRLVGFRDCDRRRLRVTLRRILEVGDIVISGDCITLLCACRSLFVFSRLRDNARVALLVVNITTSNVNVIECPEPMNPLSFVNHKKNIKLLVDNELEFKIVHVLSVVPFEFHCEYDSRSGVWTHIGPARLLYPVERLNTFDYRRMIMLDADPTPFISYDDNGPVFKDANRSDLTRQARGQFNITYEDMHPVGNWVSTPGFYHSRGDDGWCVFTVWYTRGPIYRFWKLFLLRIMPSDWSQFQLVDTRRDEFLRKPIFTLDGGLQVEETNGVVHLAALVNHGNRNWTMLLYKYNIGEEFWDYISSPLIVADQVSPPIFTSHLSL